MNAFQIIGYTFEAGTYCDGCAAERFGRCECDQHDVHGEDSEGNEVHPIFAGDEGIDEMSCQECFEPLLA